MSKNTLYNFIELKRRQLESTLPPGITSLVKDTTLQEKNYYRFELNKEDFSFALGDLQLTLIDDHVSIYQTQDSSHSEKSQYHHTGKFVDEAGQIYILHSHFDKEDELTKDPILEKRGNETTERISTKSAKHLLSQFSRFKTEKLILFLKEALNKEVDSLINQSDSCEKEACELFSELEKGKEAYWNKMDSLCSLYNDLTPLVKHSYYEKRARLIIEMKAQIQSKTEAVSKKQSESSSSEDDEVIQTKPTTVVAPPLETITKDLQAITILFIRFSTQANGEIFAVEFADLHAKVFGLISLLENKNRSATHAEMNELLKIQREIYKKIEQIFPLLLINNQFELVKKQSIFHHFIAPKHLNLALATRNKDFLDCILSIKGSELLNQKVTIKNIEYANALVFCCEQNNPDAKLADCFEVLVKNKASLMAPDTKGCPLAYSLLCQPQNPLTIRMNRIKEQSSFWKNLVSALNLYLSCAKNLNEKEITKIKQDIETYQINKEFLKSNYNFFNQQMAIWGPLNEKTLETIPEDFVARLNEDPKVKYLSERIALLLNSYFKILPTHERQKIKKSMNLTSKEFVEAILSEKLQFPNYEKLRRHILTIFEGTISSLESIIRAQQLQNELKNPRKLNRKTKIDLKECNQLLVSVKENLLLKHLLPSELICKPVYEMTVLEICEHALKVEDLAKNLKPILEQMIDQTFSNPLFIKTVDEIINRIARVKALESELSTVKLPTYLAEMVNLSYKIILKHEVALASLLQSLTKFVKKVEEETSSQSFTP